MNKEIDKQFDETKDILNTVNGDVALEYATWTNDKAKIKFQKEIPCFQFYLLVQSWNKYN